MIQPTLHFSPLLLTVCAGILGLVVGSFLNVVIYRLPARLQYDWRRQCRDYLAEGDQHPDTIPPPPGLVTPRSHCPRCGHRLSAMENIPVVSFLFLRGKCAACGGRISIRYPLIELASGALAVAVAWRLGFGFDSAAALVLSWALLALSFIDIDHQLLPDVIVLPFLWLGLLVNLHGGFTDVGSAVIGAIAGYLSLWLVYHSFKLLTGKEGMGYGDFKLFALFGAWLGWQVLPLIILLASLVGALVGVSAILILGRDRNRPLPFGPYLAAAGWITLLWGHDLLAAYLRFADGH